MNERALLVAIEGIQQQIVALGAQVEVLRMMVEQSAGGDACPHANRETSNGFGQATRWHCLDCGYQYDAGSGA